MKSSLSIFFIFTTCLLFAQNDCVYPELGKGTVWTMSNYNAKGNLESTTNYLIKDVQISGNKVNYLIELRLLDNKGAGVYENEVNMLCDDGVFIMDLKNAIPPSSLNSMQSMEVVVSGENLKYPNYMKVGETLPVSQVNFKASTSGMVVMDMTVTIDNRMVESYEKITVPAGEFTCYKISSTTSTKTRIVNTTSSEVQWFAPGIGAVKIHYYDKKGRENGYSEMTAYKKAG